MRKKLVAWSPVRHKFMSHVEQYHTVWRLHPCNLHVRLATLDGKCCMLTTKSWCIVACDTTSFTAIVLSNKFTG